MANTQPAVTIQTASVQDRLLCCSVDVTSILISAKLDYLKSMPKCRLEVRIEYNTSLWCLKHSGRDSVLGLICVFMSHAALKRRVWGSV